MTDVITSRGRGGRGRGRGRGGSMRGRAGFHRPRGRGRGRGGYNNHVNGIPDHPNGGVKPQSQPLSGKDGYCGPPLPGSTPPPVPHLDAPPTNRGRGRGRGGYRGGRGGRGGGIPHDQNPYQMNGEHDSGVNGGMNGINGMNGMNGYQGTNPHNGHPGNNYRGRGHDNRRGGGFRGGNPHRGREGRGRGRGRGMNRGGGRFAPRGGRGGFRGSDCYVPKSDTDATGILHLDVQTWLLQNREGCEGVKIGAPKEIAFYSRDPDGEINLSSRESLYPYRDPPDDCPLAHNFRNFFDRGYEVLSIDPVLQVLPAGAEVHFLSLRTCLENIASTPYNFKFAWNFIATQEENGGAIVFHHDNVRNKNMTDEQIRNNYYAHSFKAFATGQLDINDAAKVVNTRVEFRSVVTRLLGPLRLAFAAQVDAQDIEENGAGNGDLENYVKLRTVREPESDPDKKTFYGVKLRKLWFQAFLAGTGSVVVGMRDEDGVITRLVRVKTEDLPEIANGQLEELGSHVWKPSVMLGFLQRVLMLIRQVFNQHPGHTINIKFDPAAREIHFSYADANSLPKNWSVK